MKTKAILLTIILAGIMQTSPAGYGQEPDQPEKAWRHNRGERLANLSPAERQEFTTAQRAAMQDPTVQAARGKMRAAMKEFRDAMQAAMLKADPAIQPILNKIPKRGGGEE